MFKSYFLNKEWFMWAWLGLAVILSLTIGQVYMTVLINDWYKQFYNSLQSLDYEAFKTGLVSFSWLAAVYIIIATANFYLAQHYMFRWRKAITMVYLPLWKESGTDQYEGSSQRIQEDCMKFAQYAHRLGLGAFKALMTLLAFIPILWDISKDIVFMGDKIPGILVWVALITSIGGMAFTWWVGRKLPRLEYNNQKVEAAFRKQLVYAEDDKAFADIPTLMTLFTGVQINYFKLYNQYKYFTLWQNFYFQFSLLIPYMISAPSFFAATISLGILVQIGNAFDKVHESFSFFLDNWIMVNELRSITMRLKEFEKAIGYRI